MTIADEYKNVSKTGDRKLIPKYPAAHIPSPTNEDYKKGYIIRYFVKLKTNKNSIITEVNEKTFRTFENNYIYGSNIYFNAISLRWKISGKQEDVMMGNTKVVNSKELSMPGISLRLGNRLQFWKDL